jgi:hypothetical protein
MPKHSERGETPRWAKIGPPLRGCVRKPAGFVMPLAGGNQPLASAPFLSSGLPDAIRAGLNGRKVLWGSALKGLNRSAT